MSVIQSSSSRASQMPASGRHSWVSNSAAREVLVYTHFAYPIILLAIFLVAFTAHSVLTASKETTVSASPNQTGPGGKPLPRNTAPSAKEKLERQALDTSPRRKLLFHWLSLGVVVTFVCNAVNVVFHALYKRKDHWWCGESVAVSSQALTIGGMMTALIFLALDLRRRLLLCVRTNTNLPNRHQTCTYSCSSNNMDRWTCARIRHPGSFTSSLYLEAP